MKVFVRLFVITLLAATLYAFSGPAPTPANEGGGAFIFQNFACGMFDGDGGFYEDGNGVVSVVTSNGHAIVVCRASGVPNSTGTAVQYRDFYCNTDLGVTTDSHEVVSPNGNATMQCRL